MKITYQIKSILSLGQGYSLSFDMEEEGVGVLLDGRTRRVGVEGSNTTVLVD